MFQIQTADYLHQNLQCPVSTMSGNTAKFRGYLLVITKIVLILSMFFFVEQYLCYFEFLTMYSLVSKFYFSQHRMGYEKDLLSSWIS